jgi:hypothetical protein
MRPAYADALCDADREDGVLSGACGIGMGIGMGDDVMLQSLLHSAPQGATQNIGQAHEHHKDQEHRGHLATVEHLH